MVNATPSEQNSNPGERISLLVDEYFSRRQAGEELSPEIFVAQHPEIADQLRSHLAGLPLISKICALEGGDALVDETARASTDLPKVEGYELVEEIGRGGMGVAYQALQIATKRMVALKVMLAGPFASSTARRRFEREMQLAARLQHPHIVRVLEAGRVADQPYYAMEFVPGSRLDRYLSSCQVDLPETLSILAQVCQAVHYAHQQGVIHRDLKPANVLVDDAGEPHILDFGLAKAQDQVGLEESLTLSALTPGQVMGTLPYLSPEQASGIPEEVDTLTDVYALGVMLFESLTGSLPINTKGSPSDVITRIQESAPASPRSLSPQVDAELETIILKALEKEKARRYQSAAELAEDIHRYLANEPILARRPSSFYVLRKKLVKHRLSVAFGVAAVVLIAVVLAAGTWNHYQNLSRGRRNAIQQQRALESGTASRALGPAQALYTQFPNLPEAGLVYAQAMYKNEQEEKAVKFLELQLTRDSTRWDCRALLAEIYLQTGNSERAKDLQVRAKKQAPDTAEGWYLRSFATLDLPQALRCLDETVQRTPSHTLGWWRLTSLRLQTGDLRGALQGADRLIELGQDEDTWTFFKARVFTKQGRLHQAVQEYTRMTKIDRATISSYRDRAQVYRLLKEYDKAVCDYTEAIQRQDKMAIKVWDYYQRATPLWILGRRREALEDYRRVRKNLGRPFYSDARQFFILMELNQEPQAQEVLSNALDQVEDPWLSHVFRCLAGQITPDELVAGATSHNNLEQLCEAHYYTEEVYGLAFD